LFKKVIYRNHDAGFSAEAIFYFLRMESAAPDVSGHNDSLGFPF